MPIKPSVLIVDDERVVCDLLYDELSEQGYLCDLALDGNTALDKLKNNTFDVALLDIRLPGISGIDLLKEMSLNCRNTVVIMVTALNDVGTAVDTMKLGAADYIVKPFDLEKIKSSIKATLEKRSCMRKGEVLYVLDNDMIEEDFAEINAIAQGVEAKLDLHDNHFNTVTERTIRIAKELEIDESRIQRWAESRALAGRKNQAIVLKFEQSPIAQMKLGITKEYQCNTDSDSYIS